ncbi:sensor histidine kinase [Streptomyces sp. NPDC059866]|uniref:sensor histidine kinase n=1 Tax=Streptomyces sp. NPDC059866 TaxID=3346978 RepID=UPI003647CD2D
MSRTYRERTLDLGIVVLTAALSVGVARIQGRGPSLYPQVSSGAGPLGVFDRALPWPIAGTTGGLTAALVACALLWWRRRWPVAVAATAVAVGTFSPAVVSLVVALFTVAVLRPTRTALWVTAWALVPLPVALVLRPDVRLSWFSSALIGGTLVAGAVGWGLFVRALHERTDRAETEAVLHAERAQQRAREEIAREMHDVLAHRLSLLSVHAGALEFNPGAPAAEVGQAAAVIRESAHQALEDLQVVLRVLRAPVGGPASEAPQPTLGDVRRLVAESRAAGMRIELDERVEALDTVPALTGRTVYRIVQEALTNARKHAPGALVRIAVRGEPGDGLTVDVRNRTPPHSAPATGIPGTGQGLIGLAERAALTGGRLSHERDGDEHHLHAWLPWRA